MPILGIEPRIFSYSRLFWKKFLRVRRSTTMPNGLHEISWLLFKHMNILSKKFEQERMYLRLVDHRDPHLTLGNADLQSAIHYITAVNVKNS